MQIEKYISELLYKHDCVIIPALGGFVVNYRQAGMDISRQEFTPPARIVAFNAELKQNDGLLIHYIASCENQAYKEIAEKVDLFAKQTIIALNEGKRLEFEGIGSLWSDDNRFRFEPAIKQNFLRDSYGLGTFNYPLLKQDKKLVSVHPINSVVSPKPNRKSDKKHLSSKAYRSSWLVGIPAAAALVAVVIFSFTRNDAFERRIDQANLSPVVVHKNHVPRQIQESNTDLVVENTLENNSNTVETLANEQIVTDPVDPVSKEMPEPIVEKIVEPVIEETPEPVVAHADNQVVVSSSANHFYVIAGSFSFRENAVSLQSSLNKMGFEANFHDTGTGMYRVSIKAFPNRQSAINELQNLRSESNNPDLWILYM